MTRFISIIIAIVILSILVIIHEYGHFLLARKNGIFVKEFSIGFGPRILSKVAKSGTRFSWKAIPFGGSCTMLGALEDEDDDTDSERSFDKKSVWARMSVILAGPFFNFLLAFVLSVVYVATMGYDPATVTSVKEGSSAYEAGLRTGDVITNYGGTGISFGREIYVEDYINPISERKDGIKITFKRDGEIHKAVIYPTESTRYMLGISYTASEDKAELTYVADGSGAQSAGLKEGDVLTAINGTEIKNGLGIEEYFNEHPVSNEPISVTYTRRGGSFDTVVTPSETTEYSTGFTYNLRNEKTDALGTLKYSLAELKYQIVTIYKSLGILFSGHGSLDMLSGPVGIVEVVSDTYTASASHGFLATIMNLISIMTMLSANLGVLNLLPIPALDGGKFILLVIEAVIRKPVPKKVEGIVTVIGASLIFLLAMVVLVNDVIKLF
ncbi:MAG: RIP metalloprotease RseP [Lachnospiraceae bacterium]|nr:RIP metalloprotease RseP [Lachnospiraceae bacterium]